MTLLRSFTVLDVIFLAAVAGFVIASGSRRVGTWRYGPAITAAAWLLFGGFWTAAGVDYLATGRSFLGVVSVVAAGVAVYGGSLVARHRQVGWRLTRAFAVMGLLFVPFQFLLPVYGAGLSLVAGHTGALLSALGFSPVFAHGAGGAANLVLFEGRPPTHGIRIVSACTGISGIALFVGLIAATDAPVRRRLVACLPVGVAIYVLNLVRTAFVAGALAGRWFADVGTWVFGAADPALASYYVAEYVIAQALVVLVLLGVYLAVSRWLPELGSFVGGIVSSLERDMQPIVQRR